MLPDTDTVTRIIREVAAEAILPRFRNLADDDVRAKAHPKDLVTTADLEAEQRLSAALTDLLPGSLVVGEERAEAEPEILDALAGEAPVWLVDPVDGTLNFTRGTPRFAVIVALCRGGDTVMGWIHGPVEGVTATAVAGQGARLDGEPLHLDPAPAIDAMVGSTGQGTGNRLARHRTRGEDAPRRIVRQGCTGLDYVDLLRGRLHFAHYRRLKPWDHAAGVLLHREAGGHSALLETGGAYRPAGGILKETLLAAPDPETWRRLAAIIGI